MMKKILLFTTVVLIATTQIFAQNTYVPDDNFENYLETHDANGSVVAVGSVNSMGDGIANNDSVFTSAINTVISLNVDNLSISDLTGIEDFVSLKTLICGYNQLTALDVSANTALTGLNCIDNQLTTLGVSTNTSLLWLRCENNQLTALDVSASTPLHTLTCNNNLITSLNLTNNPLLTGVACNDNQLTSLDFRNGNNGNVFPPGFNTIGNPNLSCIDVDFVAYSTPIWTNIDPQHYFSANCAAINGCTDSTASNYNPLANTDDGTCYSTYIITTIGTSFSPDTIICYVGDTINFILGQSHNAVEVSNSVWLSGGTTSNGGFNVGLGQTGQFIPTIAQSYYYVCQPHVSSGMKGVIIANTPPVNGCTDSTALNYNPNAVIDDGSCTYPMTYVPDDNFEGYLEFNGMGDGIWNNDYVITQNITNVDTLSIASQYIADLTGIADFTALTYLNCYDNQLSALDVSTNTALTELNCFDNQLTTLDVSTNPALTSLNCSNNQLTTLDVSGVTALTQLVCYYNQLTTLYVSTSTSLTYLYCYNNPLTTLDVSGSTALTELWCYNNQLTTLDVSTNTALTELWCYNNQLTTLDVSTNTALTELRCSDNQLTTMDVSTNTALIELSCFNNSLTTLDVSTNTALTVLGCDNNQLTTLDVSTNTALTSLSCIDNQLTTLNVSTNTALISLRCSDNQLTTLDVSTNTSLFGLRCENNQLVFLDLRNGNNTNMPINNVSNNFTNNPDLYCIDVDNIIYSTTYWTVAWSSPIDSWMSFSTNCSIALGCTDSTACNYIPNAVIDDGSCVYPSIVTILQVGGDLVVSGAQTYLWNTNETTITITPTTNGWYWCVGTDSTACVSDTVFYEVTNISTSLVELNSNKKLIKITDVLGRNAKGKKNELLFFIYDNGTVEKRIIIE
jgi:plastocyanin